MRDEDDAFVNDVIAQMNRHKTVQQALHDLGLKDHSILQNACLPFIADLKFLFLTTTPWKSTLVIRPLASKYSVHFRLLRMFAVAIP